MGLTIHYRGTLDDIIRVEEFEDWVVQVTFALGGKPTIWRSYATADSNRIVRGVIVNMADGCDSLSLLISPEGCITPLFMIEDAEQAPLEEPPYCFVKTQFSSPLAHVALVLLLDAIRDRYASNLTVSDEGEYYETRDFNILKSKKEMLDRAISKFAGALESSSLSPEAAEDPEIVALRIERLAAIVHSDLSSSDSFDFAPLSLTDSDGDSELTQREAYDEPTLEEDVQWFEKERRRQEIRNERMARHVGEELASGRSASEALENAMRAQGLAVPADKGSQFDEIDEGLSTSSFASELQDDEGELGSSEHPAMELVSDLAAGAMNVESNDPAVVGFLTSYQTGILECAGGLSQATSFVEGDRIGRALCISQLRRALRGLAIARGAMFGIGQSNGIDRSEAERIHAELDQILKHIHEIAARAWSED